MGERGRSRRQGDARGSARRWPCTSTRKKGGCCGPSTPSRSARAKARQEVFYDDYKDVDGLNAEEDDGEARRQAPRRVRGDGVQAARQGGPEGVREAVAACGVASGYRVPSGVIFFSAASAALRTLWSLSLRAARRAGTAARASGPKLPRRRRGIVPHVFVLVAQGLGQGGHDPRGVRSPRPQFPNRLPPLHHVRVLELLHPMIGRAAAPDRHSSRAITSIRRMTRLRRRLNNRSRARRRWPGSAAPRRSSRRCCC